MAQAVRGVIARSKGAPLTLETIHVPDPGPGEALVAPVACGVCHTDLHYREGAVGDEFPYLLGHELAGRVEAVGPDVGWLHPGDLVLVAWRAPCGQCRSCLRGRPWYCFGSLNATQRMTLDDGTPLSAAIGIGGFSDRCLVAAGQCIVLPDGTAADAAALIGCGVMAGFGAAVTTGGVTRGDTVAVFGCGGVGSAAVAGASIAGARRVVAVDLDPRKLEMARAFGATDTVDAREGDPVAVIRELTDGHGVDVAIDAVGSPRTFEQAFLARDHAGVLVLVGVPAPEMRFDLPLAELFGRGGSIRPSWYGDALPTRDVPILLDLWRSGRLPLDRFVSDRIGLGDVETAFATMQSGGLLRSVVVFDR